jgi:hypothetical protein
VIVATRRLAAVAVSSQIAGDDGKPFGQSRRDLAPDHMSMRVSMEQEHRRSAASCRRPNRYVIRDIDIEQFESGHQGGRAKLSNVRVYRHHYFSSKL